MPIAKHFGNELFRGVRVGAHQLASGGGPGKDIAHGRQRTGLGRDAVRPLLSRTRQQDGTARSRERHGRHRTIFVQLTV